jgi:hypothetical protein
MRGSCVNGQSLAEYPEAKNIRASPDRADAGPYANLKGLSRAETLGGDGLPKWPTGKLLSKIMKAEMDEHMGHEKHFCKGDKGFTHLPLKRRPKKILKNSAEFGTANIR